MTETTGIAIEIKDVEFQGVAANFNQKIRASALIDIAGGLGDSCKGELRWIDLLPRLEATAAAYLLAAEAVKEWCLEDR